MIRKYVYTICLLFGLLVKGFGQECGPMSIGDAERLYEIGRFEEGIRLLRGCLDSKAMNFDEKVQAFRLISMSYLAMDSIEMADKHIVQLLLLKNNFEADIRDPDRFRTAVGHVRSRMRANLTSSVSKKAERIELAPATMQIISDEDIIKRGYTDLQQLFNDIPGFDISLTSGLSYAVMYQRGYRSAANTDRTLLLIDGVENNEMWSNAAFISRQYPLSNIKRVEIIYGPASTIYGANAFTGVVNVITKTAEDYFDQDAINQPSNDEKSRYLLTGQAGIANGGNHFGDATFSAKNKDLFVAITARRFKGHDTDLSSFPDWDGQWQSDYFGANNYFNRFSANYSPELAAQYATYDPQGELFTTSADGSLLVPTARAISLADSLDQSLYHQGYGNFSHKFSDIVNDNYISAKVNFGDIKIGLDYQYWSEGAGPDYTDLYYALNSDLSKWEVRQHNYYVRYDRNLFNRLSFSHFTYFRTSDFGKNTVTTRYYGFANGGLGFVDLMQGDMPYFRPNYYSQQSKQFRMENRFNYTINEKMDLNMGVEIRNGLLQGDYVNATVPDPITHGVASDSIAGGNYYSILDLGVYGQLSYQNEAKKLNISAGGRLDNNRINSIYGYGSVFNPRVTAIYYPGRFIFKAIYSEAFLDASVYNKFAISSARLINNPTLEPERVKNRELSARYLLSSKTSLEIAYYNASYNNILGTVNVDTMGISTTQYQAIGQSHLQGIQLSGQYEFNKQIDLYANATWANPKSIRNVDGAERKIRVGDIADLSANVGINLSLMEDKLNVNLRANFVGDKPVGSNTTISASPYTKTPGYLLINGSLTYKMLRQASLQLSGTNLTDRFYYSPGVRAASGIQSSRVPQMGRVIMAKLLFNVGN
ncbi:TonB-dependent receptor plug domain-containing protein [Olivibacter sitiensis]|uniref:TonB-dependent receptor plug domain-containing protein n=1 Tax=Olivibacter sitiensis TaxID=376470 RepID=UPI000484FE0B|nr:TonB-dependent receptor [Olivibacter sitiensis]